MLQASKDFMNEMLLFYPPLLTNFTDPAMHIRVEWRTARKVSAVIDPYTRSGGKKGICVIAIIQACALSELVLEIAIL